MPTARDFRYTVCGIAYVLFTVFFMFMYKGTPPAEVITELKKWDSISLLALVFSAPVVGIFIGTIAYGLLFLIFGYRIVYYVPMDKDDFVNSIHNGMELQHFKKSSDIRNKLKRRKSHRELMPYYQNIVRTLIKEGSAEYLERRWAVFWTHINMIAGVVAALFTTTLFVRLNDKHYEPAWPHDYIIIGGIGLAAYLIFAFVNTIITYRRASEIEHHMMESRLGKGSPAQELHVRMGPPIPLNELGQAQAAPSQPDQPKQKDG